MNDPAKISQLISSIYDAALDSARWPVFMDSLASSLNASFGMLWMHDFSNGSISLEISGGNVSAVTGLASAALAQYTNYYAGRNVWLPNASQLAEGSITVSSALYPDALLKNTEFYSDFLRQQDLFYAVGSSIVKQGTRDVKMSFVRSERVGRYNDAELQLVRQLMPHLKNAVVLHRELYRLQLMSASAMAALEMVPVGVILLTSSGLLLHANRRTHALVTRTGALRFGSAGTLHAASTTATASLQRLIHDAVQTGAGRGLAHGGALRLVGTSGRELQVLVTPLPVGSSPFGEDAMAAIFCSDPDAVVGVLSRTLEIMYRMTPAEAQLTEALVNGQSLKQYAEARCVTMNTVRTQLKAAAAKTGAKRQADLVRIVLTGPAILNPDAHSLSKQVMTLGHPKAQGVG